MYTHKTYLTHDFVLVSTKFTTPSNPTALDQFSDYNADQQQQDNTKKTSTKNPTTSMDQQNNPMTGN